MSKKKRSRPGKKGPSAPASKPRPAGPASPPSAKPPAGISAKRRKPVLPIVAGLALLVIAAAVYLLFLRPGGAKVVRAAKMNVLLITLDTTRADRLGCYGYEKAKTPNLDAIARNGVLFRNAYSQVPLTLPSHASILTGLNPVGHGVHNNGAYVLAPEKATLAEELKADGYATAAFLASFSVDSRFGLDQGFDVYDDSFQEGAPFKALNSERKAEQVFQTFSPWFDNLKTEPFFCWLHFFDPHLPYSPPAPYSDQFAGLPYDGEVAYMDYVVGLVMRKIKDRDLLGRTLVVVAGDHGEAFGEKGEAGHGVFLYDATLRVQLIVYAEGHLPAQTTVAARVRLVDVLPTVLDLLDKPAPAGIDGTSLIPYVVKKSRKDLDAYIETYYPKENFGWAPLTGLISGSLKYVRAPREEVYDLRADPAEERNLIAAEPKKAEALRAGLDRLIKESLIPGSSSGKLALTAEEQARLRSLGYVDYTDKTARDQGADPKDKLDELKMVQDAELFEYEGKYQEAAALHEKMLSLRPGAPSSYVNLALAQARMKKFDEAVTTLKLGIAKIPDSELLVSRLGYTYLVTGRIQDALTTMTQVLALNPRSVDALTATAMILDDSGRKVEALEYFERALAVEPENKFLRTGYGQSLAAVGRFAEALDIYAKLTQDYPQDPMAYQLIGFTHILLKDYDKAVENLKQAMFIKPSPPVYYFLATAYKEKGDTAETIRYLELYLEDTKGENPNRVRNAEKGLEALKKQVR